MKIAIVADTIISISGGIKLSFDMVKAIRSYGYEVDYITLDKPNFRIIRNSLSPEEFPNKWRYIFPFRIPFASIYKKYILATFNHRFRREYDIIINIQGDGLPIVSDIVYIHYPIISLLKRERIHFEKYYENPFFFVYFAPNRFLTERGWKIAHRTPVILTNSKFSKEEIQKLGRKAIVLYPPVDIEKYRELPREKERQNIVLTIARISPEKMLHVIPQIAAYTKDAQFIIIGAESGSTHVVLRKLKKNIAKYGVEDRIRLVLNAPEHVKMRLLSEAKVYLHTMPNEHFGISVIEAMAAGLVPVVHRSGGPWLDILGGVQGRYGFSYSNPEEAGELISQLIHDDGLLREVSERAVERARLFSFNSFKNKFIRIINWYAEKKATLF